MAEWKLLFRQTYTNDAALFSKDNDWFQAKFHNVTDPDSDNYSILGLLENRHKTYSHDSGRTMFHFKIVWHHTDDGYYPDSGKVEQEWGQYSNPVPSSAARAHMQAVALAKVAPHMHMATARADLGAGDFAGIDTSTLTEQQESWLQPDAYDMLGGYEARNTIADEADEHGFNGLYSWLSPYSFLGGGGYQNSGWWAIGTADSRPARAKALFGEDIPGLLGP